MLALVLAHSARVPVAAQLANPTSPYQVVLVFAKAFFLQPELAPFALQVAISILLQKPVTLAVL